MSEQLVPLQDGRAALQELAGGVEQVGQVYPPVQLYPQLGAPRAQL